MKTVFLLIFTLFLLSSSSCAVVNSLLGFNECAYEGCDRQAMDNCNYCGFHCESYYLPANFDAKVNKSINQQLERNNKPIPLR